jgi:hypothetical protein
MLLLEMNVLANSSVQNDVNTNKSTKNQQHQHLCQHGPILRRRSFEKIEYFLNRRYSLFKGLQHCGCGLHRPPSLPMSRYVPPSSARSSVSTYSNDTPRSTISDRGKITGRKHVIPASATNRGKVPRGQARATCRSNRLV